MKIRNGVNPVYADFDEIDEDALAAIDEFSHGLLTFDELAAQIGPEAAQELRERCHGEGEFRGLFDDPESF